MCVLEMRRFLLYCWGVRTGRNTFQFGASGNVVASTSEPKNPKNDLLKRKDPICVCQGSVAFAFSFYLVHFEDCLRLLRTPKDPNLPISFWKRYFMISPDLTRPAQVQPSAARGVPLFVLREKINVVFVIVHFQRICRFIGFHFFENLDFSIF